MKKFLLIALSILVHVSCYSNDSYKTVEDKAKLPILTPSFSDREIAKIKLRNDLEAYIISDPKASKSTAALVVQAGSWSDPPEYPGIAHFLEHMLFLGTEKYPTESEYDVFIKEHNGESNAYTASDHTLYLFTVNNDVFEEALDRFSNFFKKPLFNASGVSKELNVIDQEFAKNFNDDDVRGIFVEKELSSPTHPFHQFSTGNRDTLSKVSQSVLKKWYEDHYSANLMHLIVHSPIPMNTLKELVVDDFSDIPNRNLEIQKIDEPFITKKRNQEIVYIDPFKNIRELRLFWELPPEFAYMMEEKPAYLVCYVLGHEGPGSLLEELKQAHLAEELECSGYYFGSENYLVSLNIGLTEKGLEQVDQVITKVFGAIHGLTKTGIPKYIFDEVKQTETLAYQFQSREEPFEYLMKMGEWLMREDLSTFPEQTLIIQKYNPQAIHDFLAYLTPQNASITILAKNPAIQFNKNEQWMGIPYTTKPITKEQMQAWNQAQPGALWHLPESNPFIPKNLSLVKMGEKTSKNTIPHPTIIVDNDEAKIFYSKDTFFQIPKTVWYFEIKSPLVRNNIPKDLALCDLFISILEDALNPYSYMAKIADLEYEIDQINNGISISIKGYQDNAETLFKAILEKLRKNKPSKELFYALKDSLLREYQNFEQESPLKQSLEVFQSVIYKNFSTHAQKAEALKNITLEEYLEYADHLFDQTFTNGLFYGDVNENQALRIWSEIKKALASKPYPIKEQLPVKLAILPQDQGPFYLEKSIESPGNSVLLGIEDPQFSFKERAAQQILAKGMSGPFYGDLRTKQQTGYIVFNSAEEIEKFLFSFFFVQSNTHDPRELLARFELFIETFLNDMSKTSLTHEQFEIIKNSLLTALEFPPENLNDMGDLLKTLAFKYDGDFDWVSKRIQSFKDLNYNEFLEIAERFLGKMNRRRFAVLLEGNQNSERVLKYYPIQSIEQIRKISQFSQFIK